MRGLKAEGWMRGLPFYMIVAKWNEMK